MFNHRYNQEATYDLPTVTTVRVCDEDFRGKRQHYAEVVPAEWQWDDRGYVNKVVVNLPRGVAAFVGEVWQVRLCRKQPARSILFADGVQKVANPEGVPDFFSAGMRLVVSDTPENEGTLLRREGTVNAVEVTRVAGSSWLDVVFDDDMETSTIRLTSGHLPQLCGSTMRLIGLHQTGVTHHAYHGSRLVQLRQA